MAYPPVWCVRNGKIYHRDGQGVLHYQNHDTYIKDIRSYLSLCPSCKDWIYLEQTSVAMIFSRIGMMYLHTECQGEVAKPGQMRQP